MPFLTDQCIARNWDVVEEDLGRVVVDQGVDRLDFAAVLLRFCEVDEEGGEAELKEQQAKL